MRRTQRVQSTPAATASAAQCATRIPAAAWLAAAASLLAAAAPAVAAGAIATGAAPWEGLNAMQVRPSVLALVPALALALAPALLRMLARSLPARWVQRAFGRCWWPLAELQAL